MIRVLITAVLLGIQGIACASLLERESVRDFIRDMVEKHDFEPELLDTLFSQVQVSDTILETITRPAEKLPWYKYRTIFLKPDRIRQGVEFWRRYQYELDRVEELYGVPAEIVVAIIGVETRYGRNTGNFKVIDSLSTLAFGYPKRSRFFTSELEQYLLLTREQGLDPLDVKGSYAGAMGIPQFISSSYRNYAIDFSDDGIIDIWHNPADAIGSVGNYFMKHGWIPGGPITMHVKVKGKKYKKLINNNFKLDTTVKELVSAGVRPIPDVTPERKAALLEFVNKQGNEYWLGFDNFYVITRYNHSELYAMAVYQLADEIRKKYIESIIILK